MKRLACTLSLAALALPLCAKVKLATPFNDGMVLQRDREVPVWGKASPGSKVTVAFAGSEVSTTVSANGFWMAKLPAMEASKESRTLTVVEATDGFFADSETDRVELKDVLVGEVWMCSGQSNTDCPIVGDNPHYRDGQGAAIVQMTVKPFVRFVKTHHQASATPLDDYRAEWRKMIPETLAYGKKGLRPSAMGYLFARELADALDIPIGLVDSSVGGTNIDAWTPPCGYEGKDDLRDVASLPCLDEKSFKESLANGAYRNAHKTYGIYGRWNQQRSALWNGMVAAYAPMAVRGMIWYQGCHNSGTDRVRYTRKLHALYDGWSKAFANPDFKFYYVQLAPWGHNIAEMQQNMARFEQEQKNAAMAVISDVGCNTDIHPNDKRTVARRLALHALKRDYGFDWVVDNSPTLKSWKIEKDRFVLSFNDVREWYLYNPNWSVSNRFEVAGADGVWKPALIANLIDARDAGKKHGKCRGKIDGRDLVVFSPEVKEPVGLRYLYAWPWMSNLYSEVNLPLGAFEIKK